MATKSRLDQELVKRGLSESREKAQRAIMAGLVRVNGQVARKASDGVRESDQLEVTGGDRFVSRGGHKLEHALQHFRVGVAGKVAADLGASTGGFTDCLLQQGAARVFAVDVGQGQLAWKLRQDPRVVVLEQVNARHLTLDQLGRDVAPVDLVVIDCSFISLKHILPAAKRIVKPEGQIVALIKPQFEAGKEEVDRGAGVIVDAEVHERILREIRSWVETDMAWQWCGCVESPLLGPAGNKEFLTLLEKNPT